MVTCSSILAWKIPLTEEPGRLHSPWGHKELDTTKTQMQICICMADSFCCTAETNARLWGNYTPIKLKAEKKKFNLLISYGLHSPLGTPWNVTCIYTAPAENPQSGCHGLSPPLDSWHRGVHALKHVALIPWVEFNEQRKDIWPKATEIVYQMFSRWPRSMLYSMMNGW